VVRVQPDSKEVLMHDLSSRVLDRAALRAGAYPFFLSRVFQLYRDAHGATTDAPLLERLGCTPENLTRLALCRHPTDDEIRQLAARFGADAEQLAAIICEVETTAASQPEADATGGGSA
jgi:hypothetical protein